MQLVTSKDSLVYIRIRPNYDTYYLFVSECPHFVRLFCFQVSREFGFVVSSAGDWSLDLCTYPMSVMVREMNRI